VKRTRSPGQTCGCALQTWRRLEYIVVARQWADVWLLPGFFVVPIEEGLARDGAASIADGFGGSASSGGGGRRMGMILGPDNGTAGVFLRGGRAALLVC
jgi:hypothetical protein